MLSSVEFTCPTCGFDVWHPIARLGVSVVGVTTDARYPGRSIVVLDRHEEHVEDVDPATYQRFMDDVRTVAMAVRRSLDAPRVNIAILGNKEAHVHAHVFPRGLPGDPAPDQSPWAHPDAEHSLPPEAVEKVGDRLRNAIAESRASIPH